ncbi:hypothetical protein BU24DRAFT_486204 [Aaosphaeria arxii CBS 175.79]|uniref:Uncharacterized protein n=1 Tax=Aaosphaeria arxii CBS 175.79 TaxID=1450172 RepID=A0A6A5XEZ2_9PLEO|nr:uncharacterized protein BU24DRAFT_486204 [Aaosphaeria arxii CBS 175.79]KAF2011490.1 hypothetical protein BU24DRAFT_486204 [Aaosphaeria arxii CBS 175.79]
MDDQTQQRKGYRPRIEQAPRSLNRPSVAYIRTKTYSSTASTNPTSNFHYQTTYTRLNHPQISPLHQTTPHHTIKHYPRNHPEKMTTTPPSPPPNPRPQGFPLIPNGNLSAKGIDTSNTQYRTSHIRTPPLSLPFPHPKYHIHPLTGVVYEVTSPIFEEYDPRVGFVDSVGPILETVEECRDAEVEEEEAEEDPVVEEEPAKGLGVEEERARQRWLVDVKWPESSERSTIIRDKKGVKRGRDGGGGEVEGRAKRVRYQV